MKISVIAPVKNEVQFIGYSIMAALPYVHEILYSVDPLSDDGTIELLEYLKPKCDGKLKHVIDKEFSFNPRDREAYNNAFNAMVDRMTGDAAFFCHPDMIITRWNDPDPSALAWWTNVSSYAANLQTRIVKGRCGKWKNIHANKFGLHYYGEYGSTNEDFYHSDITGKAYKHYGEDFTKYPFKVLDSGIAVNHYCELKPYRRRLEKMKECLKTQLPKCDDRTIDEFATQHPRVTLETSSQRFGEFEFQKTNEPIPEVFVKYSDEFAPFTKEPVCVA